MRINQEQINQLIEAQYHYFESQQPKEATEVVWLLMEPLYRVGRYSELLQILEQTINRATELSPQFFIFHARSLSALGRHEQALVELNIVEFELKDDPKWKAAILIDKGNFLRRSGDASKADEIMAAFDEAYDLYDHAIIAQAKTDQDRILGLRNKATALFSEGTILQYFLAKPEEAMARYSRALEIYENEETRHEDGIAVIYKQTGEIYGQRKSGALYNPARAIERLEKALAMFKVQESPTRILETIYQLGRVRWAEPAKALELFNEYLKIARGLKLAREEAIAKRHIAELNVLLFKQRMGSQPAPDLQAERAEVYSSSIALLTEAERSLKTLEFDIWSRRTLANCYYLLGTLWLELDKLDSALQSFNESLKVCREEIFRGDSEDDVKRRLRAVLRIIQLLYLTGRQEEEVRRFVSDYEMDFFRLMLDYPDRERLDELILQLEAKE